jgi:hypothetical protein
MLLFAAIKNVVDTAHAIKNVIDVTKMVSVTKPTEDIELDGVTLDGWLVVSYPDIRSNSNSILIKTNT